MKSELKTLAAAWLAQKEIERRAREERQSIERELEAMMALKPEGSVHVEDGTFRVTATTKLDRKVDSEKLLQSWDKLDPVTQSAFAWKADLSMRQFRAIEAANPDALAGVQQYITTKPAATAWKIEREVA